MTAHTQDALDRDFASLVDRLVTRILPNGTPEERLGMEGEFAGLAQVIMLQAIQHIDVWRRDGKAAQKG